MSLLKAVARVTLGEQVAMQLADMIGEGHWKPGERLPSEMELCVVLNVGRSTLREALKSLAFIGMVRMRSGDGTYVSELPHRFLDRILAKGLLKTKQDLADVCETRMILETEVAALAAERGTAEHIRKLKELAALGREALATNKANYTKADLDFHLGIAHCSENKLLPRLLVDLRSILAEWITKSQALPGLRENAQEQHERILQCIAAHDPAGAREQMRAHLHTFEQAYTLLSRISESDASRTQNVETRTGTEALDSLVPKENL